MSPDEAIRAGARAQTECFKSGDLTPLQMFDVYADRIARINPDLNAFLDLRLDAARAEATKATARWRDGTPLSEIDGLVYGVKANIAVVGLPWHAGIGAYRDRNAEQDAACVEQLNAAGAIPIGTLNMHEGALGATTDNRWFGRCGNPWGEGLTPGGSSGGSGAAIAAGLCAFTLGTDTMGSVRIPSAYCGISGLKPSRGIVPTGGVIDLSPTLDHVGVHALTATDIGSVMTVFGISGNQLTDELRIGVGRWGDAVECDPGIAASYNAAVEMASELGSITDIDLTDIAFGALRRRGLLVSEVEGYREHMNLGADLNEGFSEGFRDLLLWGYGQPEEKRDAAYAAIKDAGRDFLERLAGVDILMLPSTPQGPFRFGEPVPANQADFTCLANFAGAPAITAPASVEGAPPVGVQLIGRPGTDALVVAVGAAFEARRGKAPRPF